MRGKKRLISLMLCLSLLVSLYPQTAAAEGVRDSGPSAQTAGLCEHHPQHTDECGYTEGTPCTYVCEICNPQDSGETEEEPATSGGAIDSAVTEVQALIDALPTAEELESMPQDEQGTAYEQVQAAYDAYTALTDEQKELITGAEIFDALFAVFNGMTNALDIANNVSYLDENGNQQTAGSATVVESSTTTWSTGWYVVNSNVTISSRVTVSGEVNLILADGYTLTASQGITVDGSNSLTIYGQAGGTGTLTATTKTEGTAGIGGGFVGAGGTITINGGTVEATGGSNAAGIGGGASGAGGTITINGGTVTATGGSAAAGIGGGQNGAGGTITINGGTVTATGGSEGNGGAGIGGGSAGAGGDVTITGGTVTATGNGSYGKGIGSGSEYASNGTCSISGSAVVFASAESSNAIGNTSGSDNWNGIVFQGNSGQVYGDVTLEDDLTISDGKTLTVPDGSTLTIPEGVTVTGGISTDSGGTVNNSGTVTGGVIGGGAVNVPSTVSVTVTPSPATYGSTVSITANISQASSNALTRAAANQVEFFVGTGNNRQSLGTVNVSGNTAILSNVSITTESGWALGNNTIAAEYGGGSGLLGNSGTATLTVNAIPLDAPTGLAWSTTTPGQATWSAVTNASGYSVQLYKDGSAQGSPVTASGTSYDFASTITQAGSYTFTVTATGSGAYSDSSPSSPSAALYTVSFDTNGGTGTIPMQLVRNGGTATAPAEPTRTGHRFDGWYSDSTFAEDSEWTFATSTVTTATTLYAMWTPLTYQVTLNAGDGSINDGCNVTAYTYGKGATLPTAENMTYTGHDFKGWYESSDFSGSQVTAITDTDTGDKTYYAKWEASTYEVTLNANGGSINDGCNVTEYTYGQGATLPTAQNMTYTGHRFDGWYDNEAFSGEAVTAITSTDTGDKTYYAKWTLIDYDITITVQGGAGNSASASVNSTTVTSANMGDTVTLTATPAEGYHFVRWEVTSGGVTISKQNIFAMPAEAVAITAVFEEHTFSGWAANGNDTHTGTCSCGATSTENCTYEDGACTDCGYVDVTITADPADSTVKEGETATFTVTATGDNISYRWQVNTGSDTWEDISGANSSSYTTQAATMNMDDDQYRCVVSNDTGDSAASSAATLTVKKASSEVGGQKFVRYIVEHYQKDPVSGAYALYEREYFVGEIGSQVTATAKTYTGYAYNSGAAGTVASGTLTEIKSEADIVTLKLYYDPESYSVKLEANGGAIDRGEVAEYTYGIGAELPTADDMTRTGYSFGGWYDNEALTGDSVTEISDADTGDKTYYARWTLIDYDIAVTVEGGEGNGAYASVNSTTATSANMGDTVTLTADPAEGYHFVRWEVTSGGAAISEQNTFTMPAGAVAVTAVFVEHSYTNWTANGDDTHTGTCSCGATSTENCTYEDGACTDCGYVDVTITADPADSTVKEGETATFTVTATGDNISYRWQVNTGSDTWEDISGANSSSYTTQAATMNMDDDQYRCVVSNDTGDSAASSAATLTVKKASSEVGGQKFVRYIVEHYQKDPVSGAYALYEREYFVGEIGSQVTATAKTYTGYAYNSGAAGTVASGTLTEIKSEADIVTLKLYYDPESYSVKLEANGGAIDRGEVTEYTYGIEVELPAADDVTRTGYAFGGWYDNEALTGDPVTAISAADTGDKTYYARWTLIDYDITVTVEGGEGNSASASVNSTPATSAAMGTEVALTADPAEGYHFVRWEVISGGIVISSNSFTMPAGNVEVKAVFEEHSYANWTANGDDTHTGTCSCGAAMTQACTYENGKCTVCGYVDVTISTDPADSTVKEGETATFTVAATGDDISYQWQISTNGGSTWANISEAAGSSYTTQAATMDMDGAQYRCVVSNAAGDSAASSAATLTVNKTASSIDPAYIGYFTEHYRKDPVSGGYALYEREYLVGGINAEVTAAAKTYTGYALNADAEGTVASGTLKEIKGEADIVTLKLYYDPESYSVKLEANGGTIDSGSVNGYTYGVGAALPTAEDMTYSGYVFKGWYESSDFSGEPVSVISAADAGDKTYYAKWEKLRTETGTDGNGGSESGGTQQDSNPQQDTSPQQDATPQTGDSSNRGLWIFLMLLSLSGIVTLTVTKKKRRRKM